MTDVAQTGQQQESTQQSGTQQTGDQTGQQGSQQSGQQTANGSTAQATGEQPKGQQATKTGDQSKTNADQAAAYTDFTLPEGIEIAKDVMDKFMPLAKSLNLNQEQAQSLVTLQGEFMAQQHKATVDAWNAMNDKWVATSKEHKEFGGVQFDANNKLARKVIETFVPKEELQDLDDALMLTGMGNHPVLRNLLIRVGKKMGSDPMVQSGQSSGNEGPRSLEKRMFPDMN